MTKYRCIQHVDTAVEVVVEANSEEEAEKKADTEIAGMDEKAYNQQLIDNAQAGEWLIEEIT